MNVYTEAEGIIRSRGWWQGGSEGPNGQVCLLQALRIACGSLDQAATYGYKLLKINGFKYSNVPEFNDRPSTSRLDVYRALRHAAEVYQPVKQADPHEFALT